MKNRQVTCLLLSKLSKFIAFLLPVLVFAYWFWFDNFKQMGWQLSNTPLSMMVPTIQSRAVAWAATMLPVSNLMFGLLTLSQLFQNFANHLIFTIDNVRIYKQLGICLLVLAFTENIFETAIAASMTWAHPDGMILALGLNSSQIIYLMLGGLILFTANIVYRAYLLEQEQQYVI